MRHLTPVGLVATGLSFGIVAGALVLLGLFGVGNHPALPFLIIAGFVGFLAALAFVVGVIAAGVEVGMRAARR